jgi:transcriptional regulator with XRE-family HTH domain
MVATMSVGWGEWLAKRREKMWQTQSEMARKIHISQTTISQIESESLEPTVRSGSFFKYLEAIGITPWEFIRATGATIQGYEGLPIPEPSATPVKFLEWLPIKGLANGGKIIDPLDYYPVTDRRLYRPNAAVYYMRGDSMDDGSHQAIKEGDAMLVDEGTRSLTEGKAYLVMLPGSGLTVKLARKLRGEWWLFSRNQRYEPFQAEDAEILAIVYHHFPASREM